MAFGGAAPVLRLPDRHGVDGRQPDARQKLGILRATADEAAALGAARRHDRMAASFLHLLPVLALSVIFRKYFLEGMNLTAAEG